MSQWLLDLKIRWKLTLAMALLGLIFAALAAVAMLALTDLSVRLRVFSGELLPEATLVLEADRDLYQALLAERAMLAAESSSRIAELDAERQDNLAQARERVGKAAALSGAAPRIAAAAQFATAHQEWTATSDKVAQLVRSKETSELDRARVLSLGVSQQHFSRARDLLDQMTVGVDEQAAAAIEAAEAAAARNGALVGGVALFGLTICLIMIALVPPLLLKPLLAIARRVQDIAEGEGDLTQRVQLRAKDEVGLLGAGVNRLLDRLQGLIRQIADSTLQLAAAAEQMDTVLAGQDELVRNQHLAIDQVSTAATEMTAAIHEVAGNAQATANAAVDANGQSRTATERVDETMGALRRLAGDVEAAAGVINRLEVDTDQIGTVLSVIQSIAEQTNLLALNAAIEAARAGDQGRGFAVVADEVRALAGRTQASTHDIRAMIQRLQAGTAEAVGVMQRGATLASESVDGAGQAERSLQETTNAVVRINNMAAQIAAACEEQTLTTDEIARNITAIGELSNQAASGSQESRGASAAVAKLAAALQAQVNQFKV